MITNNNWYTEKNVENKWFEVLYECFANDLSYRIKSNSFLICILYVLT